MIFGCLAVTLVVFAHGTDVHIENRDLQSLDSILGDHGLFGGVHAANGRAVGLTTGRIPGPNALDEGDFLRDLSVGAS